MPASQSLVIKQNDSGDLIKSNDPQIQQVQKPQPCRFVGKHSRDGRLSVFLQHRNSNIPSELIGLVRMNRDSLSGGVVMVGVMARLLCDTGLQYSEHFVYQRETCIYPPPAAVSTDEIELVQGDVLGDALMPDDLHRGFRIKMPAALPPSTIFLSPDTSTGPGLTGDSPWGLTYYLYAYHLTSPHHHHHSHSHNRRKSSKVFLSFTRGLPSVNPEILIKDLPPPAVTVSKAHNNKLHPALTLEAALDRAFFHSHDLIPIHIKLDNPRGVAFDGIRVTMKQLIITRGLNQQRKVIKVPLAIHEFRFIDENGKLHLKAPPPSSHTLLKSPCKIKDFPFIVDTLRVPLKPGPNLHHVAVESLLPRNTIKALKLCPSFSQFYEMQDNPLKFFAVEYYMNVHVILPWGSNLIAKLPFTVISDGVPKESIDPSANSIDNLAILSSNNDFDDFNNDNDNDHDNDINIDSNFDPDRSKYNNKPTPSQSALTIQTIDYQRVKSDFESALKLLSTTSPSSIEANHQTTLAFIKMRRTWVREFSESYEAITGTHFTSLENLLQIIMTGGHAPKPYNPGFPAELARELRDKFVPLYRRFMQCHQSPEHIGILEEALSQAFDTLELVLMKIHLLIGSTDDHPRHVDDVEVNLDDLQDVLQGRLRKEFHKLTLVIPGLIEWKWLLEELFYHSQNDSLPSNHYSHHQDDSEMVRLFQSIHQRLTEPFTDAQIDPSEILKYAQLLFQSTRPPAALKIHHQYFSLATKIYYGNHAAVGPADQDDLKTMREKLSTIREELIKAMAMI